MTPTKRQRTTKEVRSLSQAPPQPQRTSETVCVRGNISHPLGLAHPVHITRYNCLNECIVIETRYYDEELLARFRMLDDIRWLFARGGMGHFLEIKEHTYQGLTLGFLSTLHVVVTRGPQC